MNDHPAHASSEVAAIATIGQVIGDLLQVAERLPVAADQAGETASLLDRLAGEISEAAAMLRRNAGLQPPGPGPGTAQPGGGWISGPCTS